MRKTTITAAFGAMLLLTACGSTTEDRTLGGAALGASMGSGIGVAAGGVGVLPGAAVGAIVGSTMGAFTEPDRVDYGDPIWRQQDITEPVADAIDAAQATTDEPDEPQRLTQ